MVERTLAIIKPDAIAAGFSDTIINHIKNNDFIIVKKKELRISQAQAEQFYNEHKNQPFFDELISFITSGNVIIMLLERENAILFWRDLMGETDPLKAKEGTIRKLFGSSIGKNATHGSDSPASAKREIAVFFNDNESQNI